MPKDILYKHITDLITTKYKDITIYACGGFVRDLILGNEPKDLDLVVTGNPEVFARELSNILESNYFVLDETRNIFRITYRTSDDILNIDISELVVSIENDALTRDFTINSLYIPIDKLFAVDSTQHILDPLEGFSHLNQRKLIVVSETVFKDDSIRLLRAVRLSEFLDLEIDNHTKKQIRDDAKLIQNCAPERIHDELMTIMSFDFGTMNAIKQLNNLDLLFNLIPELKLGVNEDQPKEHYWDIFEHNVQTVGYFENIIHSNNIETWILDEIYWNPQLKDYFMNDNISGYSRYSMVKVACLLHDIAKPHTKTIDNERIRFKGHHREGAIISEKLLKNLRFSKKHIRGISTIIDHHLRPGQMSHEGQLPSDKAIYRFFRSSEDFAIDTIYLNLADYLAARGPLLEKQEWIDYVTKVNHIYLQGTKQQDDPKYERLINGRQLMQELGLSTGPIIGTILEEIQEEVISGKITEYVDAIQYAKVILNREQIDKEK
tara:strand:- start:1872 stop:3347 length:1476 start_codon:yes stop_codon:yes gene_type:complete